MATDYVLRVLYERLARSLESILIQLSSASSIAIVSDFDTVDVMLATDPARIAAFARCTNYEGTDGIRSLWMRADTAGPENGSDIRQSTYNASVFYERIWVKESL